MPRFKRTPSSEETNLWERNSHHTITSSHRRQNENFSLYWLNKLAALESQNSFTSGFGEGAEKLETEETQKCPFKHVNKPMNCFSSKMSSKHFGYSDIPFESDFPRNDDSTPASRVGRYPELHAGACQTTTYSDITPRSTTVDDAFREISNYEEVEENAIFQGFENRIRSNVQPEISPVSSFQRKLPKQCSKEKRRKILLKFKEKRRKRFTYFRMPKFFRRLPPSISKEKRTNSLTRYKEKRKRRYTNSNKVRYFSRQRNAQDRPRDENGRFIKKGKVSS
mmetsp:Transcript_9961/g.11930  ORF Transcript_9961/g.11930 Transcript_9961/m.11930 type:complete len:280 (+) Transcript_9961:248-1087(+)